MTVKNQKPKKKKAIKKTVKKPTEPKSSYQKKRVTASSPGSGRPGGNPKIVELGEPYRWKPGKSGNPAGRPRKGRSLSKLITKQLDIPAQDFVPARKRAKELGLSTRGLTVGDVFALSLLEDGIHGREVLIKEILNRVDGKIPDVIKGEGFNGTEINLSGLSDTQLRIMLRDTVEKGKGENQDATGGNNKRVSKKKRS